MRYRFCVISLITILLSFVMCPIIKTQSFVYADSTTDQWESVTTNEQLVEAFKYYCKSRDLTIDGSIADAVTSITTSAYQNICNKLGLDMNAIQADLKYRTDSNGKLQFLFNQSGLSTYNRIFAQFLQDNDLSVGDTVNDTSLGSGEWFSDGHGGGAFVYVADDSYSSGSYTQYRSKLRINTLFTSIGTTYGYDNNYLVSIFRSASTSTNGSLNFLIGGVNYSLPYSIDRTNGAGNDNLSFRDVSGNIAYILFQSFSTTNLLTTGHTCIIKSKNYYYIGAIGEATASYTSYPNSCIYAKCVKIGDLNTSNTNVYLTTNNKVISVEQTINEGDSITINNEGDTIINGESGGGESGGGESGGDTNIDIDFPDFNFPNIPNIDFNLGDLSHKFPFSIPFDLVAFFTVLNADPVAPTIDRTIPLPDPIEDWHFTADFSQFDNYAVIIRNVEYIGFVIGLIYLTVRFVKG